MGRRQEAGLVIVCHNVAALAAEVAVQDSGGIER
jgi:hypothetical protein